MTSTTPIDPQKSQAPNVSAWRNLAALKSKLWWQNAFACSLAFAPTCTVPAVFFTISLLLALFANSMAILPTKEQIDFSVLIPRFLAALGAFFLTMVLIVVALSRWVIALSAYARVFYNMPAGELTTRQIARDEFDRARVEAVEEIKKRKGFLFKYWLIISAVIVIPFMMANLGIAICLIAKGGLLQTAGLTMPDSIAFSVIGTCSVVCIYATVVSLIALIISANSTQPPSKAAFSTLGLSITKLAPAASLTLAVMGANLIITSPQELYFLSNPAQMFASSQNLVLSSLGQIWFGATSIFLWTLSVAPICELLRGTFE